MRWSPSAPPEVRRWPAWLTERPFAHRGLHGPGRVENSRAAVRAALDAGFGVEIDLRAGRDRSVFVFHDATLDRLCGTGASLNALDRKAIAGIRLLGSDESIPTLEEVLRLVAGRGPLLLELKDGDAVFCASVAAALAGYPGPAAVMAFDPRPMRWFARHAPERLRGLVISEQGKKKFNGLIERRLALATSKADFLAYDIRSLPSAFAAGARARGLAVLSWTVRTAADRAKAARHADQIIHELP